MKGQAKPLRGRSPGKRLFAAIVSLCMIVSLLPTTAFAEAGVQDSIVITGTSGLCEHHTEHTADCGYTEGTAEIPCSHEHDESCGGLIDPEACNHTHDETCGYVPATEGTPCTYVCEICNAQDNGNPVAPSDAQPEECTCETLCTEEEINEDCPVCSVEGAELDKVCVGTAPMLPVTALAAEGAPSQLYVGNQQVIRGSDNATYWTTDTDGNLTQSAADESWNVKYDPATVTLTLRRATIQGGTNTGPAPYGSGIYALSHSVQPVSLTIKLIGENTITGFYGIFLNAEMDASSYGTNATLTITGENNGSLGVSGSYHGIYVKSGTGNASLNIKNVAVTSSTNGNSAAGVYVMSGAGAINSPNISLSVDGGSLTASGTGSNDGILFYVGSSQASDATTSLTVSKNAIVDARNGGIKASDSSMSDLSDQIKVSSSDGTNGGIVFDGTEGTVYGNVTLDEGLTINQGETLTVPDGSSLNCNGNLTNNGTIIVEKGGNLTGDPGGTVVSAPTIGTQPASQTVTKGNTATFSVAATGEKLSYQWQQSTDNDQSWTDISGANAATYTTAATTTSMNGYQYRCVVSNSAGSVTSNAVTLTVNAATVSVTGVTLEPTSLSLFTGDTAPLTATVKPDNATNKNVTWESNNTTVATVDTNGNVAAVAAGEATITIKTADGNHTATCQVKVTQPTYGISADISALDFSIACPGYERPAAKTVTITNTGNQALTLNQPASTNSFEVGTLSKTKLAAGETATFTVQPKAGLAEGAYSETITVSGSENTSVTISATFTVQHQLEKVAAKAPTCTEAGNKEYFVCKVCGKYFDTDGKTEIIQESTVILATGHSYGEPEWSWSEDGKTCTVTFTCKNDAAHKETPKVTVTSKVKTPATCTEKGVTTYTAAVEFNGQTYTDTKDMADIPATGHSYDNGKCTVCGAISSDFKAVITAGANGSWQKGTKDGLSFTSNAAYKHFRKVQVDGKDLDAANYTVKEGSTIVTLKAEYLETLSVGKHTLAIVSDTGTAAAEFTIQAAPATDNTRYYTCQSCGHHDWTATDAGYRCDYCGRVITEQISGYPNVKGVYTAPTASPAPSTAPGSPATGDESNLVLWVVVLAAGSAALAGSFLIQRKKEQ